MKRIAIFLTGLDGGGAERVLVNLMRGFVTQGLAIDLVLVKRQGPYLSLVPPEVQIIDLQAPRLISSLIPLIRYLKEQQPSVLLSALEDTNIVALWARYLAKVPMRLVVSVHNTLSQEAKNSQQLKRKIAPYLARWFYPMADAVVTVSHGSETDLLKLGIGQKKLQVIYNPVVTPELFTKLQEKVEHPWFQAGEPPVILGVGRLEKQKDFTTLIQAFAEVKKQRDARLIILGEGSERSKLESLVESLGLKDSVSLPGFVSNPYAYMQQSQLFVLSSLYEGLPTVLIEAMAAGTPVVSTNCESGPDEILEQGKLGQLVPVGDDKALAQAIVESLNQPLDSSILRQKAEEFSLAKAVDQYCQVLQVQ